MKINCVLFNVVLLINTIFCAEIFLDKEWEFESVPNLQFQVPDTLEVNIYFPNNIPPDYLIGYNRFRVVLSDSFATAVTGYQNCIHIALDAGFLYFDHELNFKINYNSEILPDGIDNPGLFAIFQDSYPVTGMHQWLLKDSIDIDTVNKTVGFTYFHPKYTSFPKRRSTNIASTGYPFDYGLFYANDDPIILPKYVGSKSDLRYTLFPNPVYSYLVILGNGQKQNMISEIVIYSPDGRIIKQWGGNIFPLNFDLSGIADGRYIFNIKSDRNHQITRILTVVK